MMMMMMIIMIIIILCHFCTDWLDWPTRPTDQLTYLRNRTWLQFLSRPDVTFAVYWALKSNDRSSTELTLLTLLQFFSYLLRHQSLCLHLRLSVRAVCWWTCETWLQLQPRVMKNVNRRSSHGHHGSKCRELAKHAHSRGSHAFTRTLTSTQLQPRCAKRQLTYYRIWNQIFILKVPEGHDGIIMIIIILCHFCTDELTDFTWPTDRLTYLSNLT